MCVPPGISLSQIVNTAHTVFYLLLCRYIYTIHNFWIIFFLFEFGSSREAHGSRVYDYRHAEKPNEKFCMLCGKLNVVLLLPAAFCCWCCCYCCCMRNSLTLAAALTHYGFGIDGWLAACTCLCVFVSRTCLP